MGSRQTEVLAHTYNPVLMRAGKLPQVQVLPLGHRVRVCQETGERETKESNSRA